MARRPATPRRSKVTAPDDAPKVVSLDALKQINLNAAGLDIGATEIYACVPEGRASSSVRVFATFTTDLHALCDWLAACNVDTVAMESTGIYWIPIYELLVARGFTAYLVNAHHIKNVPGKKTDVVDCQWIQQLHTYGLLRASFRPEEEMCALRAYVRHREMLIRYRSSHIQHMHKALQLMNLHLPSVISDITGVTGMRIIRAIVAGERDPVVLAQHRDQRCAKSSETIAKALTGSYRAEHLFALKQALELYDFYNQQLQACDAEIEAKYSTFKPVFEGEAEPLPTAPRKHRRPGADPTFDLRGELYRISGVDLTQIDGIDVLTAQTVVAEIGLDMSRWPTVKHFTSWLGLAPRNDISGGKVLRSRTPKTGNRAAMALRMAAQSVARSQSALGAFYRRIKGKHGAAKATVATAHKLARMVYHMLKHRTPYTDPGQSYYEERYRDRVIANLRRKAKALGLELSAPPVPSPEVS